MSEISPIVDQETEFDVSDTDEPEAHRIIPVVQYNLSSSRGPSVEKPSQKIEHEFESEKDFKKAYSKVYF